MGDINKVLEYQIYGVLAVLRLNPCIAEILENVIKLTKAGEISEEKVGSVEYLESILQDIWEQLEEYHNYSDLLQKRIS